MKSKFGQKFTIIRLFLFRSCYLVYRSLVLFLFAVSIDNDAPCKSVASYVYKIEIEN